jgi:uncharacterized membrane protein YgaE (UPF0421/DUF939 family)
MVKKLIFKALATLIALAALILFILSNLVPETFGAFDWQVCLLIAAAGLGVVSLVKAIISRTHFYLIIAAVLISGSLIFADIIKFNIVQQGWLYIPIGAALLGVFLFLRYLFNIRKWDAGDNEKLGYKNYKVRQAEKEKEDIDQEIAKLKKEIRQIEKEKALLNMEIEDMQKQKDEISPKKK